jgi:hypothetical protein
MFFLNNVQNFDHAKCYGADAFYDLRTEQTSERDAIREGEEYCVFSYSIDGSVALDHWRLTFVDEPRIVESKGEKFNAFALRGKRLDVKLPTSMTKSQFAEWKPNLFNRRGHFKQFSVAVPRWLCIEPRGGVILAEEVKK